MAKIKDVERILKAAREKQQVIHNETCIRLPADILVESAGQKAQYIYIHIHIQIFKNKIVLYT